jgi:diguanylate cyclase (GGDEF)-like protein
MFIPFILACTWFYLESKKRTSEELHNSLRIAASNITNQTIGRNIHDIEQVFNRIQLLALRKQTDLHIKDNSGPIIDTVNEILNTTDLFLNAMLYTNTGKFRIIPEHDITDEAPQNAPWFPHNTREREIFFSLAHEPRSPHGKKEIPKQVSAAMHLFDINKSRIGVVGFDIDMANLSLALKKIKLPYGSQVFTVDRSGTYIFHENPGKRLIDKIPEHWMSNLREVEGFFYDPVTQKHVHYSVNPNPEWITMVTLDHADFSRVVHSFLNPLLLIVFICFIYYVGFAIICKLYVANVIMKINYGLDGADLKEYSNDLSSIFSKIKIRTDKFKDVEIRSITDPLTGLYNRRKLEEDFSKLPQNSKDTYLAIIDLDNFKSINDKYGHVTGDEILSYIGSSGYLLNNEKVTVYRFGGEEFVVLFLDVNSAECMDILNNWRILVSQKQWREKELKLTFSAGIAHWQGDSLNALMNRADQALYEAKKTGKNKILSSIDTHAH